MSELQIIVETIQKQIEQSNESQNKILRSGLKGIRIYVDGNSEVLQKELNHISKKIDGINGTLVKHDEKITEVATTVKPIAKVYARLKKGRTWLWILGGGLVLFILYTIIYYNIGLSRIVEFFLSKI